MTDIFAVMNKKLDTELLDIFYLICRQQVKSKTLSKTQDHFSKALR